MSAEISIDLRPCGTVTVAPRGDIDIAITPLLRQHLGQAIRAGGDSAVLCDLSAVSFMDCSGFGALLYADRLAHRRGRSFLVTGAHDIVWRALVMLQLNQLLSYYDNVDDVLLREPLPGSGQGSAVASARLAG